MDLAGGTLDMWPLYSFVGGAITTNLSIDIKTYVDLTPRDDGFFEFHLHDLDYHKSFESYQAFMQSKDEQLSLVKGHISWWQPSSGLTLECRSESPVGGGLGGSSSLSVSLIKAFAQWRNRELSVLDQVTLASNIEAQVLNTPTGTQDYFPAIHGGLHLLHYSHEGPVEEILEFPEGILEKNMFLVYTGRPHHSGLNNWEVYKSAVAREPLVIQALYEIKSVAEDVAKVCRQGEWDQLGELFQKEFESRVKLSLSFNSPEIDQLKKLVLQNGADAIKICGAGGGGCVMVWSQPIKKSDLMRLCKDKGFQVFDVKAVRETE